MKVMFGMALGQTTGFVESLLHLIGLDPGCAGLQHAQPQPDDPPADDPEGQHIPYRGSAGPLPLLIDIKPVNATGSSEPARGDQGGG